jgi:hypothetical protein
MSMNMRIPLQGDGTGCRFAAEQPLPLTDWGGTGDEVALTVRVWAPILQDSGPRAAVIRGHHTRFGSTQSRDRYGVPGFRVPEAEAAIVPWLFDVPPEPRSVWSIIGWWELRRVLYNLALGLVGGVSFALFLVFISLAHELKPGEDAQEPLALVAGVLLANAAFTGGWVVELLVRLIWRERYPYLGPTLLKLGLVFTLAVLLLPSVGWGVVCLVRCVVGAARW